MHGTINSTDKCNNYHNFEMVIFKNNILLNLQ